MKRCVKRHSRNSLHLLIEHERRRGEFDPEEGGASGSGGAEHGGGGSHERGAPPVFQQVAYYENPGILMIVQSVEDHNNLQGKLWSGEAGGGEKRFFSIINYARYVPSQLKYVA